MSMLNINLQNVENLIFNDKKVHHILPDLQHLFYQWKLAQLSPVLKPIAKKAAIDLINMLSTEHIKVLEQYFNSSITLDRVDYKTIHNCILDVNKVELGRVKDHPNFSLYRDANQLYICFWK
jgi:hypothetical protein